MRGIRLIELRGMLYLSQKLILNVVDDTEGVNEVIYEGRFFQLPTILLDAMVTHMSTRPSDDTLVLEVASDIMTKEYNTLNKFYIEEDK